MIIDKSSPIPQYFQLQTWLIEQIEQGFFKADDKIPTEAEIQNITGLARATIRQAIQNLVNMGYLEKVKNWNKTRDSKKEKKGESIKKTPPEEITFSKQYREVFGDDDKIPEIPETNKKKEPRSPYWLKRELASAIGITICGRCGTRTKMIPTDEGLDEGWDGYATCPKCGQKEKWRIGE